MEKSTIKKRRSLHIPPDLSDKLTALAKLRGISFNAALNVVLGEALKTSIPAVAFRGAQAKSGSTI